MNELEEVETMLAERVTEWTQKWKMEGRKEGRMEGRMEGQAALLARLLAKRFGPQLVDAALWERLHSATPDQLDRWADRILDATSMDEVFTSN
jgi:predicted transposase YdaD